jgi:predicted phosphodiesterase
MRLPSLLAAALAVPLAAGSAFAAVSFGPAVQPHGPGRVSVVWGETGAREPVTVTLSSPGRPEVSARSELKGEVHAAAFADLEPGVEYSYTIGDREGRFISPPDATQTVRFAVFGDSRSGDTPHRQIIAKVLAQRPDFYLTTGDDVADGTSMAQWLNFFEIERPLLATTPYSGVRGNHDVGALYENLVRLTSDTPGAGATYGSVDLGPAHFLLVDSESPLTAGTPQYAFIERDLQAHQGGPLFVLLHRPLYSSGFHGGAEKPEINATLAPLFEKHGVDVVFQGHDHHYERTQVINGVTYVVTGGAGAPLRSVGRSAFTVTSESVHHYLMVEASPTKIRVTATRLDGTPLDAFEIDPKANDQRYSGDDPRPAPGGTGCNVSKGGAGSLAPLAAALGLLALRLEVRRRRRATKADAPR